MDNKLVVSHNAGFFSCCTIRMVCIINFINEKKILPIVDSSKQWEFYKDVDVDVDLTPIFFKTVDENFDLIGEFKQIDYGMSDFRDLNFYQLNLIMKKYFSPSDIVHNAMNQLIQKYSLELDKTISVMFRGNDKQRETILPSYEELLDKISELRSQNPDFKLLIQSDEFEFYEEVLRHHPDAIYFNEVMKIKKDSNSAVPRGHRTNQAVIFLAIMLIISKSEKIILNSGNVGLWTTLFRGNSEGVCQYLRHKEFIYGGYNELYGTEESFWIKN